MDDARYQRLLAWHNHQRLTVQRHAARAELAERLVVEQIEARLERHREQRQPSASASGELCHSNQAPEDEARPSSRSSSSCGSSSCYSSDEDTEPFVRPKPPGLALLPKLALPLEKLDQVSTPPDELESRAEKLRRFAAICSEIGERLFLGSDQVARSKPTLRRHGVTHILNAAGTACPNYHQASGRFIYKTLVLYDAPSQELSHVLYEAMAFIEDALAAGGCIFVHCQQGVSRSASMVIAHVMWSRGLSFVEAHRYVKLRRGVAEPNAGFICALMSLAKRLRRGPSFGCGSGGGGSPFNGSATASPFKQQAMPRVRRLYRVVPDYYAPSARLVAGGEEDDDEGGGGEGGSSLASLFDPRGAYVLHVDDACFVWVGSLAREEFADAARRWARLLERYEAAAPARREAQGDESAGFVARAFGNAAEGGAAAVRARPELDAVYGPGCEPALTPATPLLASVPLTEEQTAASPRSNVPLQRWHFALNALLFLQRASSYRAVSSY